MTFNIQMNNTNINTVNMYNEWDPQEISPVVIFIIEAESASNILYITTSDNVPITTAPFDSNFRPQWLIREVSTNIVTIQDNVSNLYWTMDTSKDQTNMLLMPMMSSDRYIQQFFQTKRPRNGNIAYTLSNSDKTIYVGTDPSPPVSTTPIISSKNTDLKATFVNA